ncbi:MAG: SH3 domain-containing C40 family peptidase [Eubacteriales bacterium]|nr:SH3 domain-containing C40 family peptidase [Eubacteriales bacterium]
MKHKFTKVTIGAVVAAMLISGSGLSAEAAGVKLSLPAAGLGLTFGDGAPISQVRDEVNQKKQSGSVSGNDGQKTGTVTETETQTSSIKETEAAETETAVSESAVQPENNAETQEKEIVEAVEPVIKQPETSISDEELEEEEEKETLIIAQVNDYVNIRDIPSTDGEIVGKLYNNSVGVLISVEDDWYKMKSGNVEGYVKAEYFETGDEAKRIADEVGDRIATVNTETLKVRSDASLDASVLGLVPGGEELTVLEEENGFVKVSIEEGDGWVSMDYVILETEYVTAESVEEERARLEEERLAKEEARKAAEAAEKKLREEEQKKAEEQRAQEEAAQSAAEDGQQAESQAASETPAPAVTGNSSLGAAVANYAVQFVGNPYVYGGTSLTNGADCSGFVMSVYKNFGVSLPHSSSADRRVGYAVGSLAEAQPGDLICYSGHVAIYIGGGQIVHASTAATGIKISNANYRSILAIRRIF